MRLALAQEFQRTNRRDDAVAQYERVLTATPDDALSLNNLAWMLFEDGSAAQRERGVELAARAYELEGGNLDIADTYGWLLFKSGDVEGGLRVLEQALAASDPRSNPDLAYHLAAALSETGDRERAKSLLTEALAPDRGFFSREDAERLLRSL